MTQAKANTYTYSYHRATSTHQWLDERLMPVIQALPGKQLLDVGCGNGSFAKLLCEQGYDVVGCDPEESAIKMARVAAHSTRFHVLGVYDDPQALGRAGFDIVLVSEVIEHLFLPRKLPRFASAVIKENGYLVISTPYYGSYIKNLMCSIFNKWDDQFTALWDGGHIKFWSLKTLRKLMNSEGFEVVDYKLVNRRSRWLDWLWPNNIILVARKK